MPRKYWTASEIDANSCTFNCANPLCEASQRLKYPTEPQLNITEASVNGPMEFMACTSWPGPLNPLFEYTASDSSAGWSGGHLWRRELFCEPLHHISMYWSITMVVRWALLFQCRHALLQQTPTKKRGPSVVLSGFKDRWRPIDLLGNASYENSIELDMGWLVSGDDPSVRFHLFQDGPGVLPEYN